jgi:LysR family transcriptional regulator, regulator of abg operon
MKVDDLRWFVVIARLGNLTRAAETLGVSQPTLSKAIARLESSTKTQLLERQARGISLTDFGRALFEHAQLVDLSITDMMAQLRDLRQTKTGQLRLGIGLGVPDSLVVPPCQRLIEDGASLDITGGMTDTLSKLLAVGELDALLMGSPNRANTQFLWTTLCPDPLAPWVARDHALATKKGVTLKMLQAERWVVPAPTTFTHSEYLSNFTSARLEAPKPSVVSRSSLRDLSLASAIGGVLLLPKTLENNSELLAKFCPLRLAQPWISQRYLGVAQRKNAYQNPLTAKFIALIKKLK